MTEGDAALGPSPGTAAGPALGLAQVMPAVAHAVEVQVGDPGGLLLPPARRVVVVLLDGLGAEQLDRRGGHAPFLRVLRREAPVDLRCTFPSTTATSMGTLGTGSLPGSHGLVGLDVLDPARDILFSELSWDPAVDPLRWQPEPTVFERLAGAGVEVTRIGPGYFDGSGLTEAALRGGRFVAAATLQERVDAAVSVLRSAGGRHAVVYLYWGEIDKVGHVHGCDSWQWGAELSGVDEALRQLVRRLPPGTLVLVTSDHGMVDVPFADRLDVAHDRELAAGVRHVGGEPRALHLYCRPGASGDVLDTWRRRLGHTMEVLTRDESVRAGWFGPVLPRVLPRIGDVIVSAVDPVAVVDSRTARPENLALLGMHGARTSAEVTVPLVVHLT